MTAIPYRGLSGERVLRRVTPTKVYFGSSAYYPEPQWLVDAVDEETNEQVTLALSRCDPAHGQTLIQLPVQQLVEVTTRAMLKQAMG